MSSMFPNYAIVQRADVDAVVPGEASGLTLPDSGELADEYDRLLRMAGEHPPIASLVLAWPEFYP